MSGDILFLLWLAGGVLSALVLTFLGDETRDFVRQTGPLVVMFAPVTVFVTILLVAYRTSQLPAKRRAARESRTEADYRETLALIDWKPRASSPVDEIEDALELERS